MTTTKALAFLSLVCIFASYYFTAVYKNDCIILSEEVIALTAECNKERTRNKILLEIIKSNGIYVDTTQKTPTLKMPNWQKRNETRSVLTKTKNTHPYNAIFL